MAVPLPVNRAISLFSSTITGREVVSDYVNGKASTISDDLISFTGRIAPITDKEAARLPDGFVSTNVITVHVLSKGQQIYYADLKQGGTEQRQTYVTHQSEEYRIFSQRDHTVQGAYRKYYAVKHVAR